MKKIQPGVIQLEGIQGANVFLLEGKQGLILVDSGNTGQSDVILDEIVNAGFEPKAVQAIVLTHSHSDHVGSASELARRCQAEVWAHADEKPFIEGTKKLPTRLVFQRLLFGIGDLFFPAPACKVDRILDDGEEVTEPVSFKVIHVPGHTPGCISLLVATEEGNVLIVGDAFFGKLTPLMKELNPPPTIASVDPDLAKASLKKLADLEFRALCQGHGKPILSRAREAVRDVIG